MIPFAAATLAKVTVITVLALAGARLARGRSAAVRHVLLSAAFAALLLLPAVSLVAPAVRITIPMPMPSAAQAVSIRAIDDTDLSTIADRATGSRAESRAPAPWPSWSALAIGVWMAGAVAFLLPLIGGLWQVRSLRRTGLPWSRGRAIAVMLAREAGIGRHVDVLLHESVPGPMTCGVTRPAVLLPVDARGWPDEDLRRAILHELEHVRRTDWLGQCVARVVCACYWCHPLVWIVCRELSLEAERACDDAVIRRAEPTEYADQLVVLAERLSAAARPPALAMANRRDLAARVRAVLDSHQHRGRAGTRWVALACGVSLLILVTISPLRIVAAGQAPAAPSKTSQTFAVVTMKPCTADTAAQVSGPRGRGAGGGNVTASPGSLHIDCMTVQSMIDRAYVFFGEPLQNESGPPREDTPRVKGGPAWIRSEKYTVEAKAEGTADRAIMMGPMLRAFLEDRLKLQTHRDLEDIPAYAMTVAKGGLKIAPLASDAECKPQCGMVQRNKRGSTRVLDLGGMELEILALMLKLDRHVIDRTGLSEAARYNIHFEFPDDSPDSWGDVSGPEVFRAAEQQLGLKFEPVKAQHGVIVIDRVVRP